MVCLPTFAYITFTYITWMVWDMYMPYYVYRSSFKQEHVFNLYMGKRSDSIAYGIYVIHICLHSRPSLRLCTFGTYIIKTTLSTLCNICIVRLVSPGLSASCTKKRHQPCPQANGCFLGGCGSQQAQRQQKCGKQSGKTRRFPPLFVHQDVVRISRNFQRVKDLLVDFHCKYPEIIACQIFSYHP